MLQHYHNLYTLICQSFYLFLPFTTIFYPLWHPQQAKTTVKQQRTFLFVYLFFNKAKHFLNIFFPLKNLIASQYLSCSMQKLTVIVRVDLYNMDHIGPQDHHE